MDGGSLGTYVNFPGAEARIRDELDKLSEDELTRRMVAAREHKLMPQYCKQVILDNQLVEDEWSYGSEEEFLDYVGFLMWLRFNGFEEGDPKPAAEPSEGGKRKAGAQEEDAEKGEQVKRSKSAAARYDVGFVVVSCLQALLVERSSTMQSFDLSGTSPSVARELQFDAARIQ